MFRKLASLFGPRDQLVDLARSGDWESFARALIDADVHIFAALEGDGLDLTTVTPEEVLRETERAAMSLSEASEFMPLTYEDKERRRLPFFTNRQAAEMFAGAYISKVGRFYPMQMLEAKGGVLLQYRDSVDYFLLNDQSEESFAVPAAELPRGIET